MRLSRCVWRSNPELPVTPFLPPFRIKNMIEKNPSGFDEFGPRYWTGVVLHKKMSKTAAVLVERRDPHPKYEKRVLNSRKYLVHDELEQCRVGDKILFEKSRPYSKRKHWVYRCTLQRSAAQVYLEQNPHVLEKVVVPEKRAEKKA